MMTRSLPCVLTEPELLLRGAKMAEKVADKTTEEQDKKDDAARYKARIDRLDAAIVALGKEIRTKREYRDVRIELVRDYARKCEETIRSDTGEIVDTRALTPDELQGELSMVPDEEVAE